MIKEERKKKKERITTKINMSQVINHPNNE
jgi:hypothetical protein